MREHDWLWSTALVMTGVVWLLFLFRRPPDQNVAVDMLTCGLLIGVGSQQLCCLFRKEKHR